MKNLILYVIILISLPCCFAIAQGPTSQKTKAKNESAEASWVLITNQSLNLCDKYVGVGELNRRIRKQLANADNIIASSTKDTGVCCIKFNVLIGTSMVYCRLIEVNKPFFIPSAQDSIGSLIFFECQAGGVLMTLAIAPNSSILFTNKSVSERYQDLIRDQIAPTEVERVVLPELVTRFLNDIGNELACSNRVFRN